MNTTPCVASPETFQDPMLEDAHRHGSSARVELDRRVARAAMLCARCPLFETCLYEAVVDHDVAGVVAGTTETQRRAIRRTLGISVTAEDLDSLAGVVRGSRMVSHDEVLRLRRAHPDASLEVIANWLGCSLSTVKRHLRRARQGQADTVTAPTRPTQQSVLVAYEAVVRGRIRDRVA